jgi:hypothetical protein
MSSRRPRVARAGRGSSSEARFALARLAARGSGGVDGGNFRLRWVGVRAQFEPRRGHLGPMAQDFYAVFGLGSTDRAYDPIDAHGVELAAIKAFYERLMKDEAMLLRLEQENAELRRCGP